MQKTSETAHRIHPALRTMHLKGCDPNVCEDIDPLSEVCLKGAIIRLQAGAAFMRQERAETIGERELWTERFQTIRREYLDHVYEGVRSA